MFCISLRHTDEMRFFVFAQSLVVDFVRNFNTRAPNDNDRELIADRLNGEQKKRREAIAHFDVVTNLVTKQSHAIGTREPRNSLLPSHAL